MKSLTERLRHRMTQHLINNRTNVKDMWREMKPDFSYETLRNFYNRESSTRGDVLDRVDEYLQNQEEG